MSKHTPGPWVTFNYGGDVGQGDFEGFGVCQKGKGVEAMMGNMDVFVCEVLGGRHEKANGNLIAAAPEMLKALVDLVEEAEDIFVCMADATGIDRHTLPPQFAAAHAAIAKAEGKS